MKKLFALLLITLLLAPLTALAETAVGFSDYTHPDDRFKTVYPTGWDIANGESMTTFTSEDGTISFIVLHTLFGEPLDAPDLKEMMAEQNMIGILVGSAGIEQYEAQADGEIIAINDIGYVIYGGVGEQNGDRAAIFTASTCATGTLYMITFVANMSKVNDEELQGVLAQTVLDSFVPGPAQ